MDPEWLVQLAASGAAALVGAAATDAWNHARTSFARLMSRGDPDREAITARRLDDLAAEIARADEPEREAVRVRLLPVWQTRLNDLLEESGEAAAPLRRLDGELRAMLPPASQRWVQHITASADGAIAQGVIQGSIVNHYTYTRPEPAPRESADDSPNARP